MNEQSEHIVQDVRTKMHIVVASILISLCVTLFIYLMPADETVRKMSQEGSSRAPAAEAAPPHSAPQQPSQYWVLLGAPLLLYIGKKTTDLVFDDVIKPILIKKLSR